MKNVRKAKNINFLLPCRLGLAIVACWIPLLVAVAIALPVPQVVGQEQSDEDVELSEAQSELISLIKEMNTAFDDFYETYEEIESEDEKIEFFEEKHPLKEFVPRLLKFEEQHRGTDVGMMAVYRIFILAGASGDPNGPAFQGRAEALPRLVHYAKHDEVVTFMNSTRYGAFDPSTGSSLEALLSTGELSKMSEQYVKYALAYWHLSSLNGLSVIERRIAELEAGATPYSKREMDIHQQQVASLRQASEGTLDIAKAERLLTEIVDSGEHYRFEVKAIDPDRILVAVETVAGGDEPSIAERAEAVLFKYRYLRPGKPAPDIELDLVGGKHWSMAEQRGKIVVIQFSFTGCGPCERMYPQLKELAATYPDQVEVLTIMRDKTDEAAQEGIANGKFTWSIACDDTRASMCTQWSVSGFPTVYVVDPQGKIVGESFFEESLERIVKELLE